MLELTPRLMAVASLTEPCRLTADIGTDHAYLPAYLIEHGVIESAFACDINEGPLRNAEKTVRRENLSGITFVLCDGLAGVEGKGVEQIIIAGMGGEMIASILEKAPWCYDESIVFVLQPMTKIDYLRRFLYRNGLEITQETLAAESNKLYNIMKVRFCAKKREVSDAFALLGTAVSHPLFEEKRRRELQRLQKIADSLENKADANQQKQSIIQLMKEIEVYPC